MATKTKPADTNAQILLALDKLTQTVDKLVHGLTADKGASYDTTKEAYLANKLQQEQVFRPARPALNWDTAFTTDINWCVRCDPANLTCIKSGVAFTINQDGVLYFARMPIGSVTAPNLGVLQAHHNAGAKFHAYLTTSRQVAVKVGYPAQ